MTEEQKAELTNLWEGCFDAATAALMVGVDEEEATKLFAQLDDNEALEDFNYVGSRHHY